MPNLITDWLTYAASTGIHIPWQLRPLARPEVTHRRLTVMWVSNFSSRPVSNFSSRPLEHLLARLVCMVQLLPENLPKLTGR